MTSRELIANHSLLLSIGIIATAAPDKGCSESFAVKLEGGVLTPTLTRLLAASVGFGLALEALGLLAHARTLKAAPSEGAASFYEQTTTYGYPYWLRNGLLLLSLLLAAAIAVTGQPQSFLPLALAAVTASILGRALFYVLVIPTTLPGAFFWRNQGFVEHARETGLAKMPQVGVAMGGH